MTVGDDEARAGREYPRAPVVGVAAVVLHGDQVLLIRRGREPMLGAWSLPGGALELGETTAEGIAREVFEETGIRAQPLEIIKTLDRIVRDESGDVRFHYVPLRSRSSWCAAMMQPKRGGSRAARFSLTITIWARLH
jgi:ADP-ribose pyrophosphatase YjhB (NUDIX family)